MNPAPKSILVISLPGIGDTLNCTPIFKPLASAFPDAQVTALVMYNPCREVLETNPNIDEVILWEFLREGALASLRFLLGLRRRRFDLSIVCYPANRKEYNLISFLVGARLRLAHQYSHQNFRNLSFLNNRTIMEESGLHNVEENLRLLSLLDVPIQEQDRSLSMPLLDGDEAFASDFLRRISQDVPIVGMHAWSTTLKDMHRKCWAPENFAELAERLRREFSCQFLLFQGPHDIEINRKIAQQCDFPLHTVKNTTVRQSAALMGRCDLFITNDSGPMHIAAVAGARIVAIFGPTNPVELHPWADDYEIVRTGIDCSPCFYYSPKPLECARDDFACLTQLTVDAVYAAAAESLKEKLS
jgi:heptosyltransferase-2